MTLFNTAQWRGQMRTVSGPKKRMDNSSCRYDAQFIHEWIVAHEIKLLPSALKVVRPLGTGYKFIGHYLVFLWCLDAREFVFVVRKVLQP
jgi:hypothetical protein